MRCDHNERELLERVRREQLREIVSEILAEERALEAARQRTREQDGQEELASIRRKNLSPKEKARLIERLRLSVSAWSGGRDGTHELGSIDPDG